MCEQNTQQNTAFGQAPQPEAIQSYPWGVLGRLLDQARQAADKAAGRKLHENERNENVSVDQSGNLFVSTVTKCGPTDDAGPEVAVVGATREGNSALILKKMAMKDGLLEFEVEGNVGSERKARFAFVVTPTSVHTANSSIDTAAINPLCLLQCGGGQFLGLIANSLPALAIGGPPALLAAVGANAPSALITVINCIIKNCL